MLSISQALSRPLIGQADDSNKVFDHRNITSRRLGFLVGQLGFLIKQRATSELSEVLPICPIPFTAAWLLGLINLRGNLVPVFDLDKLLELETENVKKQKKMLLILGEGDAAGAIVINDLPIHLNFIESDKLPNIPPLPAIIKLYATSCYEKNNQLWFNFDHVGFFDSIAAKLAL